MSLFSVIIPLYNKENYVEKAINSILSQTYNNFEIIIIDDCSTDLSYEIAKKNVSEKIRLIKHDENRGLSASRNTGIVNSKAKYITFLDADDVWKPTYLEEIKSLIDTFPEAKLFATNYEEVYPNEVIILPKNNANTIESSQIIEDFFKISLGQPLYCACSLCVEKSVFDFVGNYNETITYSEDIDFNIRANLSFKLAYSKKALVSYMIFSENQITNNSLNKKVIPNFNVYEIYVKQNKSLKKYLDFNRYVFAKKYKIEKNTTLFKELKSEIDLKNLSWKQNLLLDFPRFIIIFIAKIKEFLVKKGIKFTSYSSIE
ncbi:glycosyltransferase family 2 protein [Flavobacterium sp.]|jgi:glycosyltransferase involved in cell wall biosynthesis|uniref:glycosyltransferase family 2 protein n=1 Tax=Flavobacterium sp. TaxID=239 RepID=UPI0033402132